MCFHSFYQNCHYCLRIYTHCGNEILVASTWSRQKSNYQLRILCKSRHRVTKENCIGLLASSFSFVLSCLRTGRCLLEWKHAATAVTSLLLMDWEGGWECARLTIAPNFEGELDPYSYSYSYSLLMYTPGGGDQHVKETTAPFFLILV